MFQVIQKINSVLFLLLLLIGIGSVSYFTIQSNQSSQNRTIKVASEDGLTGFVDLRMGKLTEINGHDSFFVQLYTDNEGGKLSSYVPSKIRNILFLTGDELKSKWLFKNHENFIDEIKLLTPQSQQEEELPVAAIYLNIVKEDTNFDGLLSGHDRFIIALTKPDGSQYTELDNNITQVMDSELSKDGSSVVFICQVNENIVIMKYSLTTFQKESESVLINVQGKL